MRIAMSQPNFLPWRGYFDMIRSVDLFIVYDDVPFGTRKKWRNRCMIRSEAHTHWLTVPLESGFESDLISEVPISYANYSHQRVSGLLLNAYRKAPYYTTYISELNSLLKRQMRLIADLDCELLRWCCSMLGICTEIKRSSSFGVPAMPKEQRPLAFLKHCGATSYLTGPNTLPYTDPRLYSKNKITLLAKSYDYPPYDNSSSTFVDGLSIVDLLFWHGDNAIAYTKSRTPDRIL